MVDCTLFFFGRKSFFWPIMNILIVLPILGSKYSSITLKLKLWSFPLKYVLGYQCTVHRTVIGFYFHSKRSCSIFNSCYYNILHCVLWGSWVWTCCLKQSIKMGRRLRVRVRVRVNPWIKLKNWNLVCLFLDKIDLEILFADVLDRKKGFPD